MFNCVLLAELAVLINATFNIIQVPESADTKVPGFGRLYSTEDDRISGNYLTDFDSRSVKDIKTFSSIFAIGPGILASFMFQRTDLPALPLTVHLRSLTCAGQVFSALNPLSLTLGADPHEVFDLMNDHDSELGRLIDRKCVKRTRRISGSFELDAIERLEANSVGDLLKFAYARYNQFPARKLTSTLTDETCEVTSSSGNVAEIIHLSEDKFKAKSICKGPDDSIFNHEVRFIYNSFATEADWCQLMSEEATAVDVDALCGQAADCLEDLAQIGDDLCISFTQFGDSDTFWRANVTLSLSDQSAQASCPHKDFTMDDNQHLANVANRFFSQLEHHLFEGFWKAKNPYETEAFIAEPVGNCYGLASWVFSGLNFRKLCGWL